MTITTTVRPRLIQHGTSEGGYTDYETDIGSLSGPQSFTMGAFGYGQIYDFDLRFDSERGLPLETPNFFTQATAGQSFELVLETNRTFPATTWNIWLDNDLDVELFSSTNLPLMIAGAGNGVLLDTIVSTDPNWQLNSNGTTFDFHYPIDFNRVYGARPPFTIQNYTHSSLWKGRLAFLILPGQATELLVPDPTLYNRGFLQGQSVPFHTGWDKEPASRGRPVPDMRSGLPAFAQDLVEDEFVTGIWTSTTNWDADDPRNVRQVEFPPEESLRDDDVPV